MKIMQDFEVHPVGTVRKLEEEIAYLKAKLDFAEQSAYNGWQAFDEAYLNYRKLLSETGTGHRNQYFSQDHLAGDNS